MERREQRSTAGGSCGDASGAAVCPQRSDLAYLIVQLTRTSHARIAAVHQRKITLRAAQYEILLCCTRRDVDAALGYLLRKFANWNDCRCTLYRSVRERTRTYVGMTRPDGHKTGESQRRMWCTVYVIFGVVFCAHVCGPQTSVWRSSSGLPSRPASHQPRHRLIGRLERKP